MKLESKGFYLGVSLFIIIACILMYLEKNDTPVTNGIWLILCVGGIAYYMLAGFVDFLKNILRRLKIKEIRETYVKMEIIDKYYAKGSTGYVSGTKIYTQRPDAYIMKLNYNGKDYRINDKEIFETFRVGEYVSLKLIEKLDKNKNLISYKLDNI